MPANERIPAVSGHERSLLQTAHDPWETSELDMEWSFEWCFGPGPRAAGLPTVGAVLLVSPPCAVPDVDAAYEPNESELDVEYSFRA